VIIALIFIIIAVVAVVVIRRDKKGGTAGFCGGGGCGRERFGWANWTENTDRENFAAGGCDDADANADDPLDGLEVYQQRWRRHHGGRFCGGGGGGGHAGAAEAEADAATALREGFSPDAPGACSQKFSRAAQAELDALRVAAGL